MAAAARRGPRMQGAAAAPVRHRSASWDRSQGRNRKQQPESSGGAGVGEGGWGSARYGRTGRPVVGVCTARTLRWNHLPESMVPDMPAIGSCFGPGSPALLWVTCDGLPCVILTSLVNQSGTLTATVFCNTSVPGGRRLRGRGQQGWCHRRLNCLSSTTLSACQPLCDRSALSDIRLAPCNERCSGGCFSWTKLVGDAESS